MRRQPPSQIDLLETAYELESDEQTWLSNIEDQIEPFLATMQARRRAHVVAHVAAARRLRDSIRAAHAAETCMRELLREVVILREAARSGDEDVEDVSAWTALSSGCWTLLDRFERNGRRYVVAHRNAADAPDPRALTPRECVVSQLVALGKSNKLIAFELGLADSTIGTLLSTAMRKLGVTTRPALIQLVRDLDG